MDNQETTNQVQINVDFHKPIIPFGEQLRKYRHRRYLSQIDLGDILGISKQAVSRYEVNDYVPRMALIIEYAEKLHVSVEYLLGFSDSELPKEVLRINKNGTAFYEIFANIVYLELGLTNDDIVRITGLSVHQIQAILREKIYEAPLTMALQLSKTLNVPIEVWTGEKKYVAPELTLDAYKVAQAFMDASEKDRRVIQYILEIGHNL